MYHYKLTYSDYTANYVVHNNLYFQYLYQYVIYLAEVFYFTDCKPQVYVPLTTHCW